MFFVSFLTCSDGVESKEKELLFTSSDKNLEQTFHWSKKMALSYAHDGSDAVGYWYESALPGRQAFCMRDMAHQSIAGEMLGLSKHNFNMVEKFAENISDSKDWCTFWEIDKNNNPCKADYLDDHNFWYNLNANFDIIFACWRLYEWTGDERYLKDKKLTHFFDKSVKEYVNRWQLGPEEIMERPRELNATKATTGRYRETRGLPSYVENYPGLIASSDLIASIYGGFDAYSRITSVIGNRSASKKYKKEAEEYQILLEKEWWNPNINAYHTFRTQSKFADGEGLTHMLWFNAAQQTDRIRGTVDKMMKRTNWNIENVSHFPLLWYRYNYTQEAYRILTAITSMKRKEYPEVSYGMIEGIVSGAMGIIPSASQRRVVTLPKITGEHSLTIKNLPMLQGHVTVHHNGNKLSKFVNNTPNVITWEAAFMGDINEITVNGQKQKAKTRIDVMGNAISYVEVKLPTGREAQAEISR